MKRAMRKSSHTGEVLSLVEVRMIIGEFHLSYKKQIINR
ncbi:hypothetical protein EV194_10263 [Natronoflexus pectinivorans]|uniref:Uncharacterized protein n=1 Tax=Natronoflexus pectinivorans TaxID=682526 RepID=A0A4V2RWR3_9BACT|nr:hypothetical protein EV194_10263 [Natronoflexus pectinivorans]